MSEKTTAQSHRHLPLTLLVLLISALAVFAIAATVAAWQPSTAAPARPVQMRAAPAPSPAPMAAAFVGVIRW